MDYDSQEVICGQNITKQCEGASLTKIMTCIVACEFIDQYKIDSHDTMYAVSNRAGTTKGTSAKLQEGDYVSLNDLLYCLMLPSGNDASVTIGENVSLHENLINNPIKKGLSDDQYQVELHKRMKRLLPQFYNKMNQKSRDLNLKNTNFASVHGMANSFNFTCA
jgi:D-alanyl-D-alanine carboxypeptidase (penicillin-binding protein 5/6)